MRLAPEQEHVLKELLGSVAVQLQVHLNIPLDAADEFLTKVKELVPQIAVRGQHYVLSLATARTGQRELDQRLVLHGIQAEKPIFVVDLAGRLVESQEGRPTITESCRRTRTGEVFEVLVTGSYIYYVLSGRVIGEVDLTDPGSQPVSGPRWSRRFADLDGLLSDHMKERVAKQQGIEYWKDRRRRILLSGPHGTEWIFQFDLYWWLNKFVADALRVYAEPSGLGQDKTDINVVTSEGNYIIEVKWLGKNESETEYRQDQINRGLIQVKLYLEGDESILQGYLVVYDGRSLDDHRNKSMHEASCRHVRCALPKVLFLASETPSESASSLAKALAPRSK